MKIDHIHFFVEDAVRQRNWFVQRLGWTWVKRATLPDRDLEVLRYRDTLFVLSSPRGEDGPVAGYLRRHGPGVADIAIEVRDLAQTLETFEHIQGRVAIRPPLAVLEQLVELGGQVACIAGWGSLRHTLIERTSPRASETKGVDHIVLNVPVGELPGAVDFYQTLFELQKQQSFNIQTEQSGLRSQVLFSPASQLYFNINEPTSANSQIQIFLDVNRGAGIQHIALHSEPIVPTVAALRRRGVPLLSVPMIYYRQLQQRLQASRVMPVHPPEWQQIVDQQILLDWQPKQPESLLLQIFSRPIFQENHFFFEFIERRRAVQGFGEGNFLALYRAIEADMAAVELRTP